MAGLKQKALSGFKWGTLERIATYGISFVISVIIARILVPSDYGIVGMIAIFLAISQVFIDGGFGSALIRKQDRTNLDFSTVFYYNIAISLVFYLILFVCAPLIAKFYNMPVLIPVTRVVALNTVIGAFGAMHRTKLNIAVDFKTQAKISIITLFITGTIGIFMAYKGFGVWALIIQGLASTLVSTGLIWHFVHWKPEFAFSRSSFLELFGFGSKLMLAGLLNATYTNIYNLVIGKKYNASDLGYYTRADSIVQLPASNITMLIQRVTFPVLSEIQNDTKRLADSYRRLLKMTAFIIFPFMTLLAALSEPLIKVLLTDKWSPSVPLMQILCFGFMFFPIHAINLNLLQVKGRSDLFLRLEILKKLMITIVLFVSFNFGVLAICLGIVLTSLVSLIINTYYTGKFIHVGFVKQMMDIVPIFIIAVIAGIFAYLPSFFIVNSFFQLFLGGLAGIILFIGVASIFKINELKEIKQLIVSYI